MAYPIEIPNNAPSPFTAPNGAVIFHWDESEVALAQSKYDELTTTPQQLPDGQQRPLTPQELLFFRWLGRIVLIVLAMATGV